MAWDPRWDTAVHRSHAPRVSAGEPRASATTRRVEGAPAAATADGDGPDLLGRAVEALEELAEFSAGRAARDCGAVAPSRLQALLGMEESTPTGSARDWEGTPRSDSADEPRQSSVGTVKKSVANVFKESRPGRDRYRLRRRPPRPEHILRNRRLRYRQAQLQQLTVDSWCTPQRPFESCSCSWC